jgi:hypothetical protein
MGMGSGIRKKNLSQIRVKGQKGTGSRIRIRNTVFYCVFCATWLGTLYGTGTYQTRFFGSGLTFHFSDSLGFGSCMNFFVYLKHKFYL